MTQLLWIERFKRKGFVNFILTFSIFIVILFSGANFERFIIVMTSLHRDYLPNNWNSFKLHDLWYLIPLALFVFFVVRVVIYSFLVYITYWISKKFNERKIKILSHKL